MVASMKNHKLTLFCLLVGIPTLSSATKNTNTIAILLHKYQLSAIIAIVSLIERQFVQTITICVQKDGSRPVQKGEDKGWRKITEQRKDFLIGRKPKIRKNTQGKKMIVIEHLAVSNSTVLNQELNWGSTDWNKDAEIIKYLLSQPIECND